MSIFGKLSPDIRKETRFVAIGVFSLTLVMILVFLILHLISPEQVPFDYGVILGGLGGAAVATGNFFFMGWTLQKASDSKDEDFARKLIRTSYTSRMGLQMLWGVIAIFAPCFQFVAGLLPLLFPGMVIKLRGILKRS